MKKKSANFLMVPAIAVTVMGSSYQIAPIPDNCLAGGRDKICTIPIVRCCTCTGLGADVAETWMGGQ